MAFEDLRKGSAEEKAEALAAMATQGTRGVDAYRRARDEVSGRQTAALAGLAGDTTGGRAESRESRIYEQLVGGPASQQLDRLDVRQGDFESDIARQSAALGGYLDRLQGAIGVHEADFEADQAARSAARYGVGNNSKSDSSDPIRSKSAGALTEEGYQLAENAEKALRRGRENDFVRNMIQEQGGAPAHTRSAAFQAALGRRNEELDRQALAAAPQNRGGHPTQGMFDAVSPISPAGYTASGNLGRSRRRGGDLSQRTVVAPNAAPYGTVSNPKFRDWMGPEDWAGWNRGSSYTPLPPAVPVPAARSGAERRGGSAAARERAAAPYEPMDIQLPAADMRAINDMFFDADSLDRDRALRDTPVTWTDSYGVRRTGFDTTEGSGIPLHRLAEYYSQIPYGDPRATGTDGSGDTSLPGLYRDFGGLNLAPEYAGALFTEETERDRARRMLESEAKLREAEQDEFTAATLEELGFDPTDEAVREYQGRQEDFAVEDAAKRLATNPNLHVNFGEGDIRTAIDMVGLISNAEGAEKLLQSGPFQAAMDELISIGGAQGLTGDSVTLPELLEKLVDNPEYDEIFRLDGEVTAAGAQIKSLMGALAARVFERDGLAR